MGENEIDVLLLCLAILLSRQLKDTILAYEAAAGLPLSDDILDQVQRELAEQQQQEQAAAAAAAEAQAAATTKEEL
jgi:Flp pilus assembly protein TadB